MMLFGPVREFIITVGYSILYVRVRISTNVILKMLKLVKEKQ